MTANVRKFQGRTPAWHGLGVVKEDGWDGETPVTDGFVEMGALVKYELLPIFTKVGKKLVEIEDKRVIVRESDDIDKANGAGPNLLDIVGKDYQIVQPDKFAATLDNVGRSMPVQTMGVLGKGEKYWVMFNGKDYDFQGDQFNEYLMASDDHSGGGGIRLYRTDVQVVCQNTWNLSLATARDLVVIPHTGDPLKRLQYLTQVEVLLERSRQELLDQFAAMANLKLDSEKVAEIIEAAYPTPSKSAVLTDYEETMARAQGHLDFASDVITATHDDGKKAAEEWEKLVKRCAAKRVVAADTYLRYNDEKPQFGGTAYNLVSAIIEEVDFGGVKMPGTPKSVLMGNKATDKANAINTALKLAGYQRVSVVEPVVVR